MKQTQCAAQTLLTLLFREYSEYRNSRAIICILDEPRSISRQNSADRQRHKQHRAHVPKTKENKGLSSDSASLWLGNMFPNNFPTNVMIRRKESRKKGKRSWEPVERCPSKESVLLICHLSASYSSFPNCPSATQAYQDFSYLDSTLPRITQKHPVSS